ncbi:glycosyltransferase [Priestia aryabhattai]
MQLSIVLPVYNVEPYLRECINSIYQQKLMNFEVIAINDGSTDNSLKILKEYAQKYENFHLVNQSNKGLSSSRNIGLEQSKGNYVYFFDADDILSHSINSFYDICKIESPDIITFDADVFKDNIKNGLQNTTKYKEPIVPGRIIKIKTNQNAIAFNGKEYLNIICKKKGYSPVVWKRIYKRSFLIESNILFYPNLIPAEDDLHLFQTLFLNPEIIHLSKTLVLHRIRSTSIMNTLNTTKSYESFNIILLELFNMNRKHGINEEDIKVTNWLINFFVRRIHSQKPTLKEATRLIHLIKENKVPVEFKTLLKFLRNFMRNEIKS